MGGGATCAPFTAGVLRCESAGLGWPPNVRTPCAGLPRRLLRGECAGALDDGRRRTRRAWDERCSRPATRKLSAVERRVPGRQDAVRGYAGVCQWWLASTGVPASRQTECRYRGPGRIRAPLYTLLAASASPAPPRRIDCHRASARRTEQTGHRGRPIQRSRAGLREQPYYLLRYCIQLCAGFRSRERCKPCTWVLPPCGTSSFESSSRRAYHGWNTFEPCSFWRRRRRSPGLDEGERHRARVETRYRSSRLLSSDRRNCAAIKKRMDDAKTRTSWYAGAAQTRREKLSFIIGQRTSDDCPLSDVAMVHPSASCLLSHQPRRFVCK